MNILLQLIRGFVRESYTQQPREGYYVALITLIQTGVKPGEKGLHNYTRSGRLPFVVRYYGNQASK